ncbi:hypothetical protein D3C76_1303730 [compost metagenome]
MGAFAQIDHQLEVEHPARAEKNRRSGCRQARAVLGNENIRRERFAVGGTERIQARRAFFFAHFQQQFDVETQLAVASLERLFQRGQVDQVLAFVVRGAAAVPAIAFDRDLPR